MITIAPPSSLPVGLHALSKSTLTRFLNRARAAIPLPGTVSVLLSTDAELKRLNRQFRGKNRSTDVLSFPADPIPGLPLAHQHAGDLAVSIETASRQAAEHGHPLATEIRILLLHGLLHLVGLDHETDTGEMAARESELRARFRLPSGLIARTLTPSATAAKPPRPPRSSTLRTPTKTPSSLPKRSAKPTHNSKLKTRNRQQTTQQRGRS